MRMYHNVMKYNKMLLKNEVEGLMIDVFIEILECGPIQTSFWKLHSSFRMIESGRLQD